MESTALDRSIRLLARCSADAAQNYEDFIISPTEECRRLLSVLLAGLALAAAQKPTEIKEEELKNLVKANPNAVLE
jgi:hypothetical protein